MQATRFSDEAEAMSGTFQVPADRIEEAHRLALAIERLLTPAPASGEASAEPYGHRITRGLVRSLIDSLQDLQRDSARSRRIA
jgi:hypothetical protein